MPDVYWIAAPYAGKLAIAPRPRGGGWVLDDLATLRENGIDLVVSLLAPHEQAELKLEDEAALCERAGLGFVGFPIGDFGLPDDPAAFDQLCLQLRDRLRSGTSIAVHCRMSIGRSGMLAASLLVCGGLSPADAWHAVEQARGLSVPDTDEQRSYPDRFLCASDRRGTPADLS